MISIDYNFEPGTTSYTILTSSEFTGVLIMSLLMSPKESNLTLKVKDNIGHQNAEYVQYMSLFIIYECLDHVLIYEYYLS